MSNQIQDGWHVGCPAGETYVTQGGATVKRSRNLRGLLDYGRKSHPIKVETRKDPRVREGADLRVTYADGAIGHAHFRSHGICIDWVRNRRTWRGADFVHHNGDFGYLTKPGKIAGPDLKTQLTDEQLARAELVIEGNHPWIIYINVLEYYGLDESFEWTAPTLAPYVDTYLKAEGEGFAT